MTIAYIFIAWHSPGQPGAKGSGLMCACVYFQPFLYFIRALLSFSFIRALNLSCLLACLLTHTYPSLHHFMLVHSTSTLVCANIYRSRVHHTLWNSCSTTFSTRERIKIRNGYVVIWNFYEAKHEPTFSKAPHQKKSTSLIAFLPRLSSCSCSFECMHACE